MLPIKQRLRLPVGPLDGQQNGGQGGIRTHGELPHAGFQDRCLKPLGHLSAGGSP
jgi:hypothetical protein